MDGEGLRVRLGDDFRRVFAVYAGPEVPRSPGATSRTIFGIEREGYGYGQPTCHPLANANFWRKLMLIPGPTPSGWTSCRSGRGGAI